MAKKSKYNSKRARRTRGHWMDETAPQPLPPGHYLPVDPRLTDIECPDCGATWSAPEHQRSPGAGGALDHAPTCPIGKGYADASDDDRAWFDANPEASERVRPPTMPEVQAVMLATGQALPDMPHGVRYAPGGEVVVTKLSEQLRARNFSRAVLLAEPIMPMPTLGDSGYHPDEFDEDGQLWFREHIGPSRLLDDGQS